MMDSDHLKECPVMENLPPEAWMATVASAALSALHAKGLLTRLVATRVAKRERFNMQNSYAIVGI